jgi:hypothetical protein
MDICVEKTDRRPVGGGHSQVDSGPRMVYTADRQQILDTFGDWCSKIYPDPGQGQTSIAQRISSILEPRHGDGIQIEKEELPVFCGRNDVSIKNTCRDFRKTEM